MVGSVELECLLDTGATVSVIHPSYFKACAVERDINILPCTGDLRMADGGLVSPMGRAVLELTLPLNHRIEHTFVIAGIEEPVVLGLDFLQAHFGILDAYNEVVTLDNIPHICHGRAEKAFMFDIKLSEDVMVPPGSEMILPGVVDGHPNFLDGLLQPAATFLGREDLVLAKAVINPQLPEIPVRVMNMGDSAYPLHRGTVLATCEAVEDVPNEVQEEIGGCINRVSTDVDTLPEHLVQLYEDTATLLEDEEDRKQVKQLLHKYSHVFAASKDDLGRTTWVKHTINTGTAAPIKQPPRRVPVALRDEAKSEVDRMLEQGVIQPSCSPWASPVVLVRKKDGSLRYCVDYRRVNSVTVKDSYPLPRIDVTLDALGGSKWFSTLDLASGYWQVEVDPMDKCKTAFVTEGGLFEFNVMPFGLSNAPATFERLMERVLAGLHWNTCLVYIDDVIVFSPTIKSHLERLEEVLKRIVEAGMKISPSKCQLFKSSVKFLGHVVSPTGVSTDPEKLRAIRDWPTPTKTKDVRSFLGFCSYYRKFIQGFAGIASPLHQLTEKDRPFHWTPEADKAFQDLKDMFTSPPVLIYPTTNDPFVLDTDASGTGLGSVLAQVKEGKEHAVAYFSKVFSRAEKQYCVTRRELLAIVASLKHFHHYIYGRHILVRTDHGALRWLLGFRNPEGQMARWLEIIGTYDLEIQHRPGRQHGNADALSRRPCDSCRHCELKESKVDEGNGECVHRICAIDSATRTRATYPPWLRTWPKEELQEWQQNDPAISKILQWKAANRKPDWPEIRGQSQEVKTLWTMWPILEVREGLLYKKFTEKGKLGIEFQLVAPKEIRKEVMQHLHSHRTAGHLGEKKTMANIRQRFWWSHIRDDVKRWCRTCLPCQKRNARHGARTTSLQQEPVGSPMERVAIDILALPVETDNGNNCVVVITDYFSKWTEAIALPDHQAMTVADVLVTEVFLRFGVPRIIHSDQGREFESDLFKGICALLEVQKTRTTPYRPQSDGQVERFNRTLIAMLSKLCSENQKDWDDHLPYVMCAYRATVHESTGCSPNLVMLGREVSLPIDLMYPRPKDGPFRCPIEYVEWVRDAMCEGFEHVRLNLGRAAERQKRYYDRRAVTQTYSPGEWVLRLYPPGTSRSKLNYHYIGPYLVIRKTGEVTYEIQLSPQAPTVVVHVDHLKPYEGDDVPPSWLPDAPHGAHCEPTGGEEFQEDVGSNGTADAVQPSAQPPRRSSRMRQPPQRFQAFDPNGWF